MKAEVQTYGGDQTVEHHQLIVDGQFIADDGGATRIWGLYHRIAEEINAAAERRGYDRAVANLRDTLGQHWLAEVVCDHERQQDNVHCACSLVNLGWHPTVGDAVNAWIDHVLEATKETDR